MEQLKIPILDNFKDQILKQRENVYKWQLRLSLDWQFDERVILPQIVKEVKDLKRFQSEVKKKRTKALMKVKAAFAFKNAARLSMKNMIDNKYVWK